MEDLVWIMLVLNVIILYFICYLSYKIFRLFQRGFVVTLSELEKKTTNPSVQYVRKLNKNEDTYFKIKGEPQPPPNGTKPPPEDE